MYSSNGGQIEDGFSSAGGFGNTFENLTKIDIKNEGTNLHLNSDGDDENRIQASVVNLIKAEEDR